ncbi:MAG: hypothetical protein LBB73_00395 [Dysgonamonadaceae bacterium]|jgi:cyanophycinase|nr:hypothetical protein [Dysgonamonadaceae bacterium]
MYEKGFLPIMLLFTGFYAGAQNPVAIDSALTTRHGPEKGSLVIIGGGEIGDEIWEKCIALAGGKDSAFFVIVTNATPDSTQYVTRSLPALKNGSAKSASASSI